MSQFQTANQVSGEFEPRRRDAPLQDVYGVGPTTAERLEDSGFLTVYDLAASSPKTLYDSVDELAESDAREFVEQARSIVEYWPGDSE